MSGLVRTRRLALALVCASTAVLSLAGTAGASQLLARNASHIKLAVNSRGTALVTYSVRGRVTHLLAWGAVNARKLPKSPRVRQVEFKLDYSGGWRHHRLTWKHFRNTCRRYDGPELAWMVSACKAPNGSYWALQSWQTALPDLGLAPWLAQQKTWWLRLSHWTGPLARLDVYTDWIYSGRFQEVFGSFTYNGDGVRGFGATPVGAPTDNYGRLVFLDTYNSAYGKGWKRENSFLTHGPPGIFCYGFYPRNPWVGGYKHPRWTPNRKRPLGIGERYRITAAGPGVTPDVMWEGPGLHPYNRGNPSDVALESAMNAERDAIRAGYRKCAHD